MIRQVQAPSTRNPRLPAGCKAIDILGRVHVAVMSCSTVGTGPFTNRQRHLLAIAPTVGTGLTGRRKAVGDDHFAPVPRGFVFNLPPEFAHADIGYRARKVMILHHAADIQIFQRQGVRTANQ